MVRKISPRNKIRLLEAFAEIQGEIAAVPAKDQAALKWI